MNIVLVEPEIPQNTGNIARTCAVTDSSLHLVRPLGFSTDDKYLKRAGLDYWQFLDIYYYDSIQEFFKKNTGGNFYFSTKRAPNSYDQISYQLNDFILFGKETEGLNKKLLKENIENCIRIPMINQARSLNLSNSVAIILYEAMRQLNFKNLKRFAKFK